VFEKYALIFHFKMEQMNGGDSPIKLEEARYILRGNADILEDDDMGEGKTCKREKEIM
jgi:hypothetical protein